MTRCNIYAWMIGVVWCVVIGEVVSVGPRTPDVTRAASEGSGVGRISHSVSQDKPGTAVLRELQTITDLILRSEKREVEPPPPPPVVHDCSTLYAAGVKGSGVYRVFPFTFFVYCDMEQHGGGWTVIQRRRPQEVQVNFAQRWEDYRGGFGELAEEMWLGLEPLYQLTHSAAYELRVDMVDYQLGQKYAHYKEFQVGPESDGYRLLVANYSGNAGDALSPFHSGRRFSTLDRDQDLARNKSCARDKEGGWWFHACYAAHPNGRHSALPSRRSNGTEMRWWSNREKVLVLTHIEMKIRRRRPHGTPAEGDTTVAGTPSGDQDGDYDDHPVSPTEGEYEGRVDYDPWWDTLWAGTDGTRRNDSDKEHIGRSDISPWEVARRAPQAP